MAGRPECEQVVTLFAVKDKPKSENNWWNLFKSLGSTLIGIQSELAELRAIKGTVNQLSTNFNEDRKLDIEGKVQVLELCNSEKDFQIKLLTLLSNNSNKLSH